MKTFEEKNKNIKKVEQDNQAIIDNISKRYNDAAQHIAAANEYDADGIAILARQRTELAAMGIDTNKLYSVADYVQYVGVVDSAQNALTLPYDKRTVDPLIQNLSKLKNSDKLNGAQKVNLDHFYQLLQPYCRLSAD